MEAIVTPYNLTAHPDRDCWRLLTPVDHQTTIQFPADGLARIRVRGLRFDYSDLEPVEIERLIEIPGH